jgi:hypothetical protein
MPANISKTPPITNPFKKFPQSFSFSIILTPPFFRKG